MLSVAVSETIAGIILFGFCIPMAVYYIVELLKIERRLVKQLKKEKNKMPLYEFKCKKCGEITERITKSANHVGYIVCGCGYSAVKIISRSNFALKDGGVGWEKQGYNRKASLADGKFAPK